MPIKTVDIRRGRHINVLALSKANDEAIFIEELIDKLDKSTRKKIATRIDYLANTEPPIKNDNISKKLHGYTNLFELKANQVRLFYFLIGNIAIITHGFIKKKQSTPKEEIKRAETLKSLYQSTR